MGATLYIVSTPIGNLDDMTFRAVQTLKEADLIACEDTRHSRHLLDHFGIKTKLVSYHEHNEQARTAELVARLAAGDTVALISDAGTPLISDPGYRLVSAAIAAAIRVVPIPGASAILGALAASGLATDSFYFGGFLPAKSSARRAALEEAAEFDCTLVFYEAPHRAVESLRAIEEVLGTRPTVLARELTKLHEELLRGTPAEIAAELDQRPSVRGEITLVVNKPAGKPADDRPLAEALEAHLNSGLSRMDAIKAIAKDRGLPKRQVYDALQQDRED